MLDGLLDIGKLPVSAGVISIVSLFWLYRVWSAPKAPGVWIAKYSRLWYLNQVWSGHFEKTDIDLHKEFGPIVRVGPRDYSIDDPEAVKIIYAHGTQFYKSSWYTAWSPPDILHINLFATPSIKGHAIERRKLASMYSMSTLVSYEAYVDNCISLLCEKFKEFSKLGTKVNMAHWMQCFAFDVIGEITLGERFGFLDEGQDIGGIMQGIEKLTSQSTLCGIYLWTTPFVFGLFGSGVDFVTKFVERVINNHVQTDETGPTSMLTKLFNFQRKDPDNYTRKHLFTGCAQNIIAGSDTTSISLNAIFYYMMQNPEILAKVRAEVDSADSSTFAQAQKLTYLQAVIKEALRMHPATGLPLWRVVPNGGASIAGQWFPAGVNVGINSWVAHHNKSVFGQDAHIFRPERWLESSPEQLASMERYYMPFGLGSRTCIGKNISLLEISKLVPTLVKNFDFNLEMSDWTLFNHWFVKQKDFEVKVSIRQKS